MSARLANRLMNAASVEAFFAQQKKRLGWQQFAALKSEVDRLVHHDLNAAARLIERIEALARLTEDPSAQPFARAARARVLHLLGRHDEANRFYEAAVDGLQALKLARDTALVRKQQVDALTHAGRYRDALQVATRARRLLARTDPIHLAQLEANVGNIYYMLDRYGRALAHYDRARAAFERHGEARMRALVDLNRANIFTELDRPEEAAALLEEAMRAFTRARQFVLAAQAQFHLAYLDFLRGNYNAALRGYDRARDRLAELGNLHLVAWCDLESAEVLLALNAFDDARERAGRARDEFRDLGMPYESAKSRLVVALAAMGLQQFEEAEGELTAAGAQFEASRNAVFTAVTGVYLADLALRRGDAASAGERAARALGAFTRHGLMARAAQARLLAARAAHEAGDTRRARRLAKAALAAIENRFAPSVAYQCHHLLARMERDAGRRRAALEGFRRAVEVIERMRGGIAADELKSTFLRDKVGVYEDAVAACLDEGGERLIEEAFRLVESSKSRALADLLARYLRGGALRGAPPGSEDKTRDRLLKLISELNWYSTQAQMEDERDGQRRAGVSAHYARQVSRAERQIAQLFRRLQADHSPFEEAQRMRAASLEEFRGSLDEDETAIEYFTTGDDISAFIISRRQFTVARGVASRGEVEGVLGALKFQFEKFNFGAGYADDHFEQLTRTTNQYLARLYRRLFAPLEGLARNRRLLIIPHGALHYLPFHALLSCRGYLIDLYEIAYAPSATVSRLCRRRGEELRAGRAGGGRMVALGCAEQETPSIAAEIRDLRRLFPDAVALTGGQATRRNLLRAAPTARFLHLASHGYFRRDNPMFSFLKLADAPLNFYSLLDLKLKAELVTLSACHTGVNAVFPGDELHGLMRGFLYAGAPSLVASLWAASDEATALLMREMYGEIWAGASKRAALRAAQLAIKDQYGHPYYWAPFILMGDAG